MTNMPITTNGWIEAIQTATEHLPHDLHLRMNSREVGHEPTVCVRCRAEHSLRELIDLIATMTAIG